MFETFVLLSLTLVLVMLFLIDRKLAYMCKELTTLTALLGDIE